MLVSAHDGGSEVHDRVLELAAFAMAEERHSDLRHAPNTPCFSWDWYHYQCRGLACRGKTVHSQETLLPATHS